MGCRFRVVFAVLMLEPDDEAACDLVSGPINGRGRRQQSIIAIGEKETGVMLLEDS